MKKLLGLLLASTLLTSCVTKLPLSADYFQNSKKVGLLVNVNPISKMKAGGQGLLDMALTSGDKFKEPLETVDKNLNTKSRIKDTYSQIYSDKGKQIIVLDETYDKETALKFDTPETTNGKKFSKIDFRALKAKYNVDELVFVDVNYGVLVSYYGMIELGQEGHCVINSEIIDLSDNSLLYKDTSSSVNKLASKWKNPPLYESLQNAIDNAITNSINLEKEKIK